MSHVDLQYLNSETKKDKRYHHEDTIHDIQFNWYGDMMATCSSDHKVKIWEKQEDGGWDVIKEILAHYSPVWRVSWAHPDYGVLLATCSMDHRATIWRMNNDNKTDWIRKELKESSTPVTDVKFAPRTWSDDDLIGTPDHRLRLAACSDDKVRLYFIELYCELNDTYSCCSNEFIIEEDSGSISCLSWSSAVRFSNLILAVGIAGGKGSSRVDLYSFPDTELSVACSKKWHMIRSIPLSGKLQHLAFRPNNGAKDNILAVAIDVELLVYKLSGEYMQSQGDLTKVEQEVERLKEDHVSNPIKHVSWDLFGRQIIALFASGTVKCYSWKYQPRRRWEGRELVSSMDLYNINVH